LKVEIVKEVIAFLAFVGLSISCYIAWFSSIDYVVAWSKGVHNCHVPYGAPAPIPRVKSKTIRSSSVISQANKGALRQRREGRLIRVNDLLRIELMDECLGKK